MRTARSGCCSTGEIYNYPELRAELLQRGHKFTTKSDTEAIVHLYEDYSEECFSRLRGMFSIALWDSRNRKLVLVRDRVGKKAAFLRSGPQANSFRFGTESTSHRRFPTRVR